MLTNWHGVWEGELTGIPARTGTPSVQVRLEVNPGDDPNDQCLTWRSTFSSEGEVSQIKDFQFCYLPNGRWVTDEGEGLLLDAFVAEDIIYSGFRVNDVTLFTMSRLEGDIMTFDIYFTRTELTPVEGVISFSDGGIQRTVFHRIAE